MRRDCPMKSMDIARISAEKKPIIARVAQDGRVQTLAQHTLAVAGWAELFGSKIAFGCIMRLVALLHDLGKATKAFQDYIKQVARALAGECDMPRRGSVTHSTQAAKLIFEENIASPDVYKRVTAELCAIT